MLFSTASAVLFLPALAGLWLQQFLVGFWAKRVSQASTWRRRDAENSHGTPVFPRQQIIALALAKPAGSPRRIAWLAKNGPI